MCEMFSNEELLHILDILRRTVGFNGPAEFSKLMDEQDAAVVLMEERLSPLLHDGESM